MRFSRFYRRYQLKRLRALRPHSPRDAGVRQLGLVLGRLCLAIVMLACPSLGLIEGGKIELSEVATPAEEKGDGSEIEILPVLSLSRRGTTRSMKLADGGNRAEKKSRTRQGNLRQTRFVQNDRISLEMVLPLRC